MESAASALGMSARTLQRELARLDTSFTCELRSSRVTAAEALLVHSDLKIDAIALKIGFGNASRMSAASPCSHCEQPAVPTTVDALATIAL